MTEIQHSILVDLERLLAKKYMLEVVNIDCFVDLVEETSYDDLATREGKTTYIMIQRI